MLHTFSINSVKFSGTNTNNDYHFGTEGVDVNTEYKWKNNHRSLSRDTVHLPWDPILTCFLINKIIWLSTNIH
jgi:hypothetical protein